MVRLFLKFHFSYQVNTELILNAIITMINNLKTYYFGHILGSKYAGPGFQARTRPEPKINLRSYKQAWKIPKVKVVVHCGNSDGYSGVVTGGWG